MAAECVLLYHCGGPEWARLRQTLVMLRLRLRMVEPRQYGLPLETVASGKAGGRFEEAGETEESFSEPMMVFCYLDDSRLDQALAALRRAGVPQVGLKAVLTTANREWNSRQLWNELRRERQAWAQRTQTREASEC